MGLLIFYFQNEFGEPINQKALLANPWRDIFFSFLTVKLLISIYV